jgi:hypothetical protein
MRSSSHELIVGVLRAVKGERISCGAGCWADDLRLYGHDKISSVMTHAFQRGLVDWSGRKAGMAAIRYVRLTEAGEAALSSLDGD